MLIILVFVWSYFFCLLDLSSSEKCKIKIYSNFIFMKLSYSLCGGKERKSKEKTVIVVLK